MKHKVTFTYGGQDITVTKHVWGDIKNPKTKEVCEGWKRDGCSRHYSLKSIDHAVTKALLNEFNCTSGETIDELFDIFDELGASLSRIARAIEAQQGAAIVYEESQ